MKNDYTIDGKEQIAEQANERKPLLKADLISSIVVFGFGLFVFFTGFYIAFYAVNGTKVWYYSPGMFPMVVGFALVVFSIIMFVKKKREGASFTDFSFASIVQAVRTRKALRLALAILLFAVYVFGTIGRLPFVVATFLYLFVTMTVFRSEGYAIWKLLIISVVTTAIIYVFFGIIAAVPLP